MVRFDIADCDHDAVAQLCERVGVSGPVAQALVRRGYADPDSAAAFLAADEHHRLEDFPGLLEAAQLIVERTRSGTRIT
ncbi:MAG TPA: hypothetical protein VFR48_02150, partial [Solirubrobacteraceae bacterium]|nr:hypothetical protein [Solirubrobacteraceae bacterium]